MCFLETSLFVCVFVFHTKIMELIWHVHFVQAAGKYKQKGRDYIVEDGDIILFKFNAGAGLTGKKKWCQGENGSCASRHWPFLTSVLSVATCDVTLDACSKSKGRVCLLKDIECHQKEQNVIWEWKQHFEKRSQSLSQACLPRLQCKTFTCNVNKVLWSNFHPVLEQGDLFFIYLFLWNRFILQCQLLLLYPL